MASFGMIFVIYAYVQILTRLLNRYDDGHPLRYFASMIKSVVDNVSTTSFMARYHLRLNILLGYTLSVMF